jgi:hypothetical protein
VLPAASSLTWLKECAAFMSTVNDMPFAIAAPLVQRVPVLPSSALPADEAPFDAVAVQPERESAVSPPAPVPAAPFVPAAPVVPALPAAPAAPVVVSGATIVISQTEYPYWVARCVPYICT